MGSFLGRTTTSAFPAFPAGPVAADVVDVVDVGNGFVSTPSREAGGQSLATLSGLSEPVHERGSDVLVNVTL